MQPKISLSQTSLSPSFLAIRSFPHSPSLCFSALACPWWSNQIKQCKFESRSTRIVALDTAGNYIRKLSQGVIHPSQVKNKYQDAFGKMVDSEYKKAVHPRDDANIDSEPARKKPKLAGETKRQERKDGMTVATGDFSASVDLEIKGDGEYVMKMKRIIQSSNDDGSEEDELERAKKMAQNAALLLLHADMLREMGEKLLDQSRASLRSRVTSM